MCSTLPAYIRIRSGFPDRCLPSPKLQRRVRRILVMMHLSTVHWRLILIACGSLAWALRCFGMYIHYRQLYTLYADWYSINLRNLTVQLRIVFIRVISSPFSQVFRRLQVCSSTLHATCERRWDHMGVCMKERDPPEDCREVIFKIEIIIIIDQHSLSEYVPSGIGASIST